MILLCRMELQLHKSQSGRDRVLVRSCKEIVQHPDLAFVECAMERKIDDSPEGSSTSGESISSRRTPRALVSGQSMFSTQAERSPASVSQPSSAPAPLQTAVTFDRAFKFVNQIKDRFKKTPEIYNQFLNILTKRDSYKNENSKESGRKLTEDEIYSQVAKLFKNHDDLLDEFALFLPNATIKKAKVERRMGIKTVDHSPAGKNPVTNQAPNMRRPSSKTINSPNRANLLQKSYSRRPKLSANSDPSDAGNYDARQCLGYDFFEKVQAFLENVVIYRNFLRCLHLFNRKIVSSRELLKLVSPFLSGRSDLLQRFRKYIGIEDSSHSESDRGVSPKRIAFDNSNTIQSEEIDFSTCKRLGASYCLVPKDFAHSKCSGKTSLCKEVLNDSWVLFPSWSKEDPVTLRKTQFEELMFRCEDERYELEIVIETNAALIRVLENLQKKLLRMSKEELSKLKLDDCLEGTSASLNYKAIMRLYGQSAQDVMEGLKLQPISCVPIVLRRLRAKDEEWRSAQKKFNKLWGEQNEKFYLKSLDHQGINFKQIDLKALQLKSLFNEIKTLYSCNQSEETNELVQDRPHLSLCYKDKRILDDAANLLIHHVKRQTSIKKEEKQRIKHLLQQFLSIFFKHSGKELHKQSKYDSNDAMDIGPTQPGEDSNGTPKSVTSYKSERNDNEQRESDDVEVTFQSPSLCIGDGYTHFTGNDKWYLFLRLHQILCERLTIISERANILVREESKESERRCSSTALALGLKPKSAYLIGIEIDEYYKEFLKTVKNVLDGIIDAKLYEDTLREMFGIHAYIAFTFEKVISSAVKQLHLLVMEAALDNENCYVFKILTEENECRLIIELLSTEEHGEEESQGETSGRLFHVDSLDTLSKTEELDRVDALEKKGMSRGLNDDLACKNNCGGIIDEVSDSKEAEIVNEVQKQIFNEDPERVGEGKDTEVEEEKEESEVFTEFPERSGAVEVVRISKFEVTDEVVEQEELETRGSRSIILKTQSICDVKQELKVEADSGQKGGKTNEEAPEENTMQAICIDQSNCDATIGTVIRTTQIFRNVEKELEVEADSEQKGETDEEASEENKMEVICIAQSSCDTTSGAEAMDFDEDTSNQMTIGDVEIDVEESMEQSDKSNA